MDGHMDGAWCGSNNGKMQAVHTYGADEAAEGGNALALHDGVTTLMYEGGQSIRSELLGRSA